jgi:hypothetical protein
VLTDSPIAYWRLGEASGAVANDQRGSRPGSYVGSPTLGIPGGILDDADTAASFSTGQYVTIPDAAALSPEAGAAGKLSLEAWVKLSSLPAGNAGTVLSKGNGSGYEYSLRIQPNGSVEIVLWTMGGSTYQAVASPAGSVAAGAWYHLVGTCQNGVACRVYVNGVQSAAVTTGWGGTTPGDGPAAVMIGRRADGVQPLVGTIDEAAIYGTALSGSRVQAHYAAGR